jgi:hypothetical protein
MITYNEQNPYIPDPELVKEMSETVAINCAYGDHTKQVFEWLEKNNIEFRFRNQWSNGSGQPEKASFTISDEKQRMTFMLRWA